MWKYILLLNPITARSVNYYQWISPYGIKTYQIYKCSPGDQQTHIIDPTPPRTTRVDGCGQVTTTQVIKQGNHFLGGGHINGTPFPMMVDAGASFVSMNQSQARSSGITVQGRPIKMQTANGTVKGLLTHAQTVKFAGRELKNVPVVIQTEGISYPGILLGMSYLSHFDININGQTMSLTRK